MNEKKLGAIIVLIVALVAPVMILTAYAENGFHTPATISQKEILAIQNGHVKENTASLSVYFTLQSTNDETTPIDKLELTNIEGQHYNIYFNGSSIDCNSSPVYRLQVGDTVQVSIIVPYVSNPYALSSLHNAGVAVVHVYTGCAIYYTECSLNGGVSD